ncbi:hypothetical protein FEM08_00130 [Flavobacterium gilvum]|nr:hypothetical protein FEM08_00130 [Flavobacterium gilvum]
MGSRSHSNLFLADEKSAKKRIFPSIGAKRETFGFFRIIQKNKK